MSPRPRLDDRPGAAGLSAFGLGARDIEMTTPAPARAEGDARFALSLLAGALGGVYVTSGLTLLGRLSGMALVLTGLGVLQAGWAAASHLGHRRAIWLGLGLNLALIVMWLLSRTIGVSPGGGGRQPIGVLDSLCTLDALMIVMLTLSELRRLPSPLRGGALAQVAILLAVLSVSALLGGHTHTAQAAAVPFGAQPHLHLYCRLL